MADLIISSIISGEVPIPAPDALTDFAASVAGTNQINIGWVDPGLLAAHYILQYSQDSSFNTGVVAVQLSSTPMSGGLYMLGGLLAATHYYFRIKAVNPTGESAWVLDDESTA